MSKRGINRIIFRYVLEIFIVFVFLIVSYIGLVNNNLASFASVASTDITSNRDVQILYSRNDESIIQVLSNSNVLDAGVLSVLNPNDHVVTISIILKIQKNPSINLDLIDLVVNDKKYDLKDIKNNGDYYSIFIENKNLEAYEKAIYNTSLNGDALYVDTNELNYYYEITESFYN